jgi:hypothetical protein
MNDGDTTRAAGQPERRRDVYWLGGGSGAGKSTVAQRLADRFGLHVYSTDDVMADHAQRSSASSAPYLKQFIAMDMDERWVRHSPDAMLETFHWFRGEAFELIIEDVERLPADVDVIVEGFRLLPDLVAPHLPDPRKAVWLLPTPEFRMAAFDSRGTTWHIPHRTTDPEAALRNLLDRDRMFTDRLASDTARLGLSTIEVAPGMTEGELTTRVTRMFGL